MPTIRPISDLRNRADEISRICHSSAEPVFITKNGREDLVVMSQAAYERSQARLDLYAKLDEAESEAGRGAISHDELMRRLKSRLG
ncbi:MAG TPA: type II toxin-antitoxin system prevent-host-death family antitoxin [Elusimicrobiota bacterium]|jgi:prevent-host-death family protein|nr:type II toxin-antitoxin system prevent-host-death family antitoxin [Elusimicrobiota bacterium]